MLDVLAPFYSATRSSQAAVATTLGLSQSNPQGRSMTSYNSDKCLRRRMEANPNRRHSTGPWHSDLTGWKLQQAWVIDIPSPNLPVTRNLIPSTPKDAGGFSLDTIVPSPADAQEIENPRSLLCTWLTDSLLELDECPTLAQEEELDLPSDLAIDKTASFLTEVSKYPVEQPDVYPMQESSIAIDFRNPHLPIGVLFLIEHDGSGVMFYGSQKSKGRTQVRDASDLLDEGGLHELQRAGILQC